MGTPQKGYIVTIRNDSPGLAGQGGQLFMDSLLLALQLFTE